MFNGILDLHNLIRWFVLIAAVYVLFRSILGLLAKKKWDKRDKIAASIFTGILDLQLLIGLGVYAISPNIQSSLQNMAQAMKDSEQRFFAVEHISIMILTVVLAHIGAILLKRASTDSAKYRFGSIFFGITTVLILYAIPWSRTLIPGM